MDTVILVISVIALIVLRDAVRWIFLSKELDEIKQLLRQLLSDRNSNNHAPTDIRDIDHV